MSRDWVEPRGYDESFWGKPQSPGILAGLNGAKFEDPDFGPNEASLYYDANNAPGFESAAGCAWKRFSDIYPDAELFKSNQRGKAFGASDIMQGAIGDCWLMSALSIVATRPDLLENLCVEAHPQQGLYEFRFFKEGRWQTVVVDDFVPVTDWGAVLLGRSHDKGEAWVPMIEKAYAKLHGRYQCLNGGATIYGLVDMTGGAAERINFDRPKGKKLISKGKLLDKLRQSKAEGWLMGCVFRSDGGHIEGKVETTAAKGLIGGHAYALLDVRKVSKGGNDVWLVRVRNPWGQSEWTGAWSDGSKEWDQSIKDQLNYDFANDGTFWMSFTDWQKHVQSMEVCRTYRNTLDEPFYCASDAGTAWKVGDGTAVGQASLQNPQYILQAEEDTSAYVFLVQKDNMFETKLCGCLDYKEKCIGFWVLHSNGQRCEAKAIYKKLLCGGPSAFVRGRSVAKEITMKKGKNYIIMPTQYQPNVESEFQLYVFSASKFTMTITTPQNASGKAVPAEALPASETTKRAAIAHEKGWRTISTEADDDDDDQDESVVTADVEREDTDEKDAASSMTKQKRQKIADAYEYIMPHIADIEEPVNLDWILDTCTQIQNWMHQLIVAKKARNAPLVSGKRLGAEKVGQIKQLFNKYDTDGSKSINVKELQNLMKDMGRQMTWHEAQKFIAACDPDHTGKIEFGEFLDWYGALEN